MQIFYYNLFTVPLSRMDALRNILFLVFRVTDSTSIGFFYRHVMYSVWSIGCLVSRAGLNSNASSKSLTPSTATYQHGQELILPPAFLVYPQGQVISVRVEKDQENRERYREATSCMRPHFFKTGYSTDMCLVF